MVRTAVLVLAACVRDADPDDPDAGGPVSDDPVDTPSDTDTVPELPPPTVADVGWRLHDDFATLVYLGWTQTGTGSVRVDYSVDDDVWLSSPTVERDSGDHEQLLLGLPFQEQVDWRLMVGDVVLAEGSEPRTGPAPDDLPIPSLEGADPGRWFADGRYLLTSVNETTGPWSGGPFWTVILDRAGRTVWARQTTEGRWTLFAQVSSRTGDHLLLDEDSVWSAFDQGETSEVTRIHLDGPIDSVATPGLQHAFVEHPDGTLAWGSLYHGDVEALMVLPFGATEPTALWTCNDWPGAGDVESNGLFYDQPTHTYLYSFWSNDTIVSVDATTGESLWWAGGLSGGYSFDPSESQYSLQHGVSYTDQGTLLVSTEAYGPTRTEVREYAVDHASHTLSMVWKFDAEVHAVTNGDAWRLANGNTLHVVGSAGVIKEATTDGAVVWEVDYHSERLLGRGEFLDDLYRFVE